MTVPKGTLDARDTIRKGPLVNAVTTLLPINAAEATRKAFWCIMMVEREEDRRFYFSMEELEDLYCETQTPVDTIKAMTTARLYTSPFLSSMLVAIKTSTRYTKILNTLQACVGWLLTLHIVYCR